ncbi:iduronate 2-sulfatase isoform X2 [Hermetia illucens]|uniref:iduronate 2-sulfatase isoform X2 n=1 Tax=Hermetia illucens TaxID=343691 RepID=UPI0018CC724F|nr:iduronate 2-sulfatase isoform X2 [Hermetia illucens]
MATLIAILILILVNANEVLCENRRPNVVLILADDLRPTIEKYGDQLAITPNLDRFIERSSYFTRAYSQQALCAPSRNSMLTSRRPDTLHLYDFYSYWRTFAGNFTTLPQYFKENGYYTYSVGKIFHPGVSSNFTDDYPFSWSEPTFHPSTERYMNQPVCPDGSGTLRTNLICPVKKFSQPEGTLPDIESKVEAKNFLAAFKNRSQPFFLAVGFHKPHIPFRIPDKYFKLYPQTKFGNSTNWRQYGVPDVAWNPYTDIRKRHDVKQLDIPFPYGPIPSAFGMSIKQAYYASVSYIDNLFGNLLSAVDLNNTIVVFASDHGWSLGEHGEWAKYSNFEVALRVPLVVYAPGITPRRIDNIVELVDLFPTLVDLVNLPPIAKCKRFSKKKLCTEGNSLLPLLKGLSARWPDQAFSQYPRPGPIPRKNSDKPRLPKIRIMGYTVRKTDFRYTIWMRFYPRNFSSDWSQIFGEELYDHRFDSAENENLVDRREFKRIRLELRSLLKKQFSFGASLGRPQRKKLSWREALLYEAYRPQILQPSYP